MINPADRQPIIVADAGPLIRLAAAGLLDTLRGLNRRIVLVDRVEDEIIGDRSKPFAAEIAAWLAIMGDAILRVETVTGHGIAALKEILTIDPAARIVMCSALGQETKVLESIRAGAKDFVVKPFQPDRVLDAIGKAVG